MFFFLTNGGEITRAFRRIARRLNSDSAPIETIRPEDSIKARANDSAEMEDDFKHIASNLRTNRFTCVCRVLR